MNPVNAVVLFQPLVGKRATLDLGRSALMNGVNRLTQGQLLGSGKTAEHLLSGRSAPARAGRGDMVAGIRHVEA